MTKPQLTDASKATRLYYCLGHVNSTLSLFDKMYDVVHVDEKYFYVTEVKKRFYLLPDEDVPYRPLRSWMNVTVLDRCGPSEVGRDHRHHVWRPYRYSAVCGAPPRPAIRRNRPAGTMETHNVSVTKDEYRNKLIQHVLPAIGARMPLPPNGTRVAIQQDNAPPHIATTDPEFYHAVLESGRDVALRFPPPNSPNLNCCDLGLFTAVQARQIRTIDELIEATEAAFLKRSCRCSAQWMGAFAKTAATTIVLPTWQKRNSSGRDDFPRASSPARCPTHLYT